MCCWGYTWPGDNRDGASEQRPISDIELRAEFNRDIKFDAMPPGPKLRPLGVAVSALLKAHYFLNNLYPFKSVWKCVPRMFNRLHDLDLFVTFFSSSSLDGLWNFLLYDSWYAAYQMDHMIWQNKFTFTIWLKFESTS